MKVVVDTKSLRKVFRVAGSVSPSKSPLEIIQAVKFSATEQGECHLVGTDLETWVQATYANLEVHEPGSIAIPKDMFEGILRTCDDDTLQLTFDSGKLEVLGKTSKWQVVCPSVDDFHDPKDDHGEVSIQVKASDLVQCFKRTSYVPIDSHFRGWSMAGLLVEWEPGPPEERGKMAIVACDGRRMARQEVEAGCYDSPPDAHTPIISPKLAKLLTSVFDGEEGEVQISFCKHQGSDAPHLVVIRSEEITVTSALMEGRFPPYRAGMSQEVTNRYTIATNPLRRAIDQVAVASTPDSSRVEMKFSESGLKISLPDTGVATANSHVQAKHDGEEAFASYDHRYLSAPLGMLDADAVDLELCGNNGPLVIRSDGFEGIVLPLVD